MYLPWVIPSLNVGPEKRPQLGLYHDLSGIVRTGLDEVGVGAGEGGGRDVVALQPVSDPCTHGAFECCLGWYINIRAQVPCEVL